MSRKTLKIAMATELLSKMSLALQPRDIEIIRFVYAHRVASYSQIWQKFFAGRVKSIISDRLKRLRKEGYLKSAMMPIKGNFAERYFMPSKKAFQFVRHHWGFEVDRPLYKSESILHDLRLVDLTIRMERLSQFKKLLPENLLQSSTALVEDPFLGDMVRAQSDGALYVTGKTGRGFLFALEMELSTKNVDRYKSKLSSYYLARGIHAVLYVCADQTIVSLLTKADEEIRKDQDSILHFAFLSDALKDNDRITFRNAKRGSFDLE